VLDAGGVIDMAKNLMIKSCLQLLTALIKELELMSGEFIERVIVRAYKVREDRPRDDCVLMFQPVDKFIHVFFRIEAQAMHARIEFDVDRITRDTLFLSSLDQCIKQTEGIDFRLEIIVKHGLESAHLRVHDHDVARDAITAQHGTFIGHSHCEIVDTVILQCLGNLHTASAIGVGLDHTYEFGFRLHERTVIVEVFHHST